MNLLLLLDTVTHGDFNTSDCIRIHSYLEWVRERKELVTLMSFTHSEELCVHIILDVIYHLRCDDQEVIIRKSTQIQLIMSHNHTKTDSQNPPIHTNSLP